MSSRLLVLLGFASAFSCAAALGSWLDPAFTYRWFLFTLWVAPVLILLTYLMHQQVIDAARKVPMHYWALITPLILIRFCFLESYPFIAMHDEIRDGALRSLEIATGARKNIFGVDWSQGLLFADICSFLVPVFGSDVRVYRVIGALVSSLDILMLFLGLARLKTPRTALIAAFVMGCLPVHHFFARTEPLISFTSLFTTLLLLAACRAFQDKEADLCETALNVGLLTGLAMSFHASVRSSMLLAGIILAFQWIRALIKRETNWIHITRAVSLYLLAGVVAFGPQILYVDREYLSGASRIKFLDHIDWIFALGTRYLDSLQIYLGGAFQTKFDGETFLAPLLSVLLILGMLRLTVRRSQISAICLAAALLFPLTNSAITDVLNGPHRVLGCAFPVSVLIADGINVLVLSLSVIPGGRVLSSFAVSAFLIFQLTSSYGFFRSAVAERHWETTIVRPLHKGLRYLVQYLKSHPEIKGTELCLYAAPGSNTYQELLPPHIFEFFSFFTPGLRYLPKSSPEINGDNILYATFDCSTPLNSQRWETIEPCKDEVSIRCPTPLTEIKINIAIPFRLSEETPPTS